MYPPYETYDEEYPGGEPQPGSPDPEVAWWEGPPPPGYTGPWPPPLPPGAHYGPNFGQIIYGPGAEAPTVDEGVAGGQWPGATNPPPPPPSPPSGGGGTPPPGPTGTGGSGIATPAPFEYPNFEPPEWNVPGFVAPAPFHYPEFTLPSGQEVLNEDPSYGLRRDEGMRAITNNALARGVARGGATLKSLMDFAGSLASQEYGSAANRRFGMWQANRGAAADEYDRTWRNLLTDYSLKYGAETDEYNRALSTYNTNLGKESTRFGFGLDLSNFKLNDRNSFFDRLMSLYDLARKGLPMYQF